MTDIEIVNAALANLGCGSIAIMDNTSAESRLAQTQYANARDALLQAHQWTFAKTRIQLNKEVSSPLFGLGNRYIIPGNVLTVIRCYDLSENLLDDWVREGSYVLTDAADSIYAEVLVRVSESAMPPLFVKVLIAQLSADWAIPLTENKATAAYWTDIADKRMADALVSDGRQGISEQIVVPHMRGRRGR